MEWQPIETAPRSRKSILVWVPKNRSTFCVCWSEGTGFPGEEHYLPGWVIFGAPGRGYLPDGPPSHWMPVPAPPEIAP